MKTNFTYVEEKVIQIAVAESRENTTILALTSSGRIFKGGDVSTDPYKFRFGWKSLICPIFEDKHTCKHGPLPDIVLGSWWECPVCKGSVPSDAEDLDGSQTV